MKITVAKYGKDSYIILETEEKTVTYKTKMLIKTSEITYIVGKEIINESEVFEVISSTEEINKDDTKEE